MAEMKQRCELCDAAASLYCESDDAFLCWACDAAVHGANFLVARHVRRVACDACRALDAGRCVSGAGSPPVLSVCRSCSPRPPPAEPSSSSCLSAAESSTATSRAERPIAKRLRPRWRPFADARAERVLASWSRRMGLRDGRRCVAAAARAIGACEGAIGVLPVRVTLAAALWLAAKLFAEVGDDDSGRSGVAAALRRLEACSGVPARLIVIAESRLARAAVRH